MIFNGNVHFFVENKFKNQNNINNSVDSRWKNYK